MDLAIHNKLSSNPKTEITDSKQTHPCLSFGSSFYGQPDSRSKNNHWSFRQSSISFDGFTPITNDPKITIGKGCVSSE